MTKRFFLLASLVAAFSLAGATLVPAAHAAGAKARVAADKAEAAKPAGEAVEYANLENRIGETVSIETTYDTTRTGKLIKYTQPALTLDIGSEAHSFELSVPKETIKSIRVIGAAAAESDKDAGTSGAKKN
jgi:hypothetical protein